MDTETDFETDIAAWAGRVWTHRLSAAEIACGAVDAEPDLAALEDLLDEDIAVIDGGRGILADRARWAFSADDDRAAEMRDAGLDVDDAILLPLGLLSDFAPGELIGIRVVADEGEPAISVIPVAAGDIGAPPQDLGARIADLLQTAPTATDNEDPLPPFADSVALLHDLCEADPALFVSPLPPLGEILSAAGYVVVDGDVLPADVDVTRWRLTRDAARIARRYGIPPPDALTVAALSATVAAATARLGETDEYDGGAVADAFVTALDLVASDPETAAPVESLADPDVAEAFLAEALGIAVEPAIVLGALAEGWERHAPPRARVALRWLRSRCEERLGDPRAAEASLDATRALDARWPPVLEDLARYAAERGDATAAISLLRQAGVADDDDELAFLLALASPARPDLGRNQPCWCGSGRKYKVCHRGREALPLADRAGWLYRKAVQYVESGPDRYLMMELAQIRAAFDSAPDALLRALADPLLHDAVLFEGGVAAGYLDERGYLLPDDERALFEQWLLTSRSVYEVEEVRYGRGFSVRDLRTGDRLAVDEKTASKQIKKGARLLMRLAPVGVDGARQVFGGAEPVAMHQEQAAIALCDALDADDAGPVELVTFATARFAPPTLQTTDGAPLAWCTATYDIIDSDAAATFLASRFEDAGDGHFTATDGDGPFPTVLAHLELLGGTLTLETMNERRFAEMQQILEAAPGLTLADVQRVSAADMMRQAAARAGSAGSAPGAVDGMLDPSDPAVAEALAGLARHHEEQWLTESIPALGGLTPREAALDPTRREDLIRLLDTFDDMPGLMDVTRLREALGL
jgi:hypothetical protein